jgi:citrate lyase subunit beta / citryl-CoA lyase
MPGLGLIRSALFVPGNRPERIDKALATKADVVIIDLEDAVPAAEKARAREVAVDKLKSGAARILIRINGMQTPYFQDDLDAVLVAGLNGMMIPKVEEGRAILDLHERMRVKEEERGLKTTPVLALIETAKAIANVRVIAQAATESARPHILVFGAADYTADLGIAICPDGLELAYPRARLAVASRAADMLPPIDTPFMLDLKDMQGLEADARRAKQLGFAGKLCIHPNQIEIVNRIFSPMPEEVHQAKAVVDAFEKAQANGLGAIQVDGKFIDKPVVERAQQILRLATVLGVMDAVG